MFNGFFEEASEAGVRHYTIPRNLFDLFDVSEAQFLSAATEVRKAGELVSALQKRRLPKRSLIIDSTTVRREDRPGLLALVDDLRSPRRQRDVRSAIREGMGNAMTDSVADVWLDIPRPPDVDEEALRCPVILSPTRVAPLSELMPAEDWVKSHVANKLRGHLFLRGSLRQRRRAATSALAFLRENYRIRLDPLARGLALKE